MLEQKTVNEWLERANNHRDADSFSREVGHDPIVIIYAGMVCGQGYETINASSLEATGPTEPTLESAVVQIPQNERLLWIGRANNNHIVVEADGVSKLHGMMSRSTEGLAISDADSTYGITVNGHRLESESKHPLRNNDRIAMAKARMMYFDNPRTFYAFLKTFEK